MKEITRIHLAQTPFNSEVAAKKQLEIYLEAIRKALDADDDTMREIEARIVELLAERGISGEKVITKNDITAIEQQLGAPSDFVDNDTAKPEEVEVGLAERRLFRNTDRGVLGGVCAGIADYLKLNPMWVRLLALLAVAVSFGMALIVYVVLWLVIPAARTATEKLQMRGEAVTLTALQSEAVNEAPLLPERSKPLVIVLRVALAIGFIGAAIVALLAIGVGVFGLWSPMMSLGELVQLNQPLVLLTVALASLSGLLFVLLMSLAAYASATWQLKKRLAQVGVAVIATGLVLFAIAVGTGTVAVRDINQRVEALRTTTQQFEPKLRGVTSLKLEGSSYQTPLRYVVTSDQPRVEINYLKGQAKPQLKLQRDGKLLRVSFDQKTGQGCRYGEFVCQAMAGNTITVYGPALASIQTSGDGGIDYEVSSQAKLSYVGTSSSWLGLNGQINQLETVLSDGARLSASSASVEQIKATLKTADNNLELGNVRSLELVAPLSCGTEMSNSLYVESAQSVSLNGKPVDTINETVNSCLTLTVSSQSEDDDAR